MSPFGPYKDFDECLRENSDKDDPEAYCAVIKRAIEGREFTVTEASNGKKLLLNVEIFQTGVHVPAEGPVKNWTQADAQDVVDAFHEGINNPVHLKIGHTSPEFCALVAQRLGVPVETVRGEGPAGNGMISLGQMVDARLSTDGRMVADFEAPERVADLIEKGYTDVSVEMEAGYPGHAWVLSAVALLGAERPAVKGLAGLEEQAVLSERKPTLVARFSVGAGQHIVPRMTDEEPDMLQELEEFNSAMETFIKGKRAAQLLRGAWEQVKDKWAALLGQNYSQKEGNDVDIKNLAKRLNMQEEATEDQVMTRLDQLLEAVAAIAQALGIGTAPEELVPEEMAAKITALMEKVGSAQFSENQVTQKLQAAEGRIEMLERAKRVAAFQEITRGFTAIPGKPEELAGQLIELEDKVSVEAKDRQVEQWKQTQKYAEAAGVLTRLGTSRGGDDGKHPLELEMEAWAKKETKSMAEAYAHFRENRPGEWREYRQATRDGQEG